ncbi:hypothetical protein DFH07DRAFT_773787 [Mycena maculata]|uniref:Uncharacterized protein n=1 Tax=Mycena maculata TaxID=230809 RepID=A0AAD7NB62_9AGAR|nr:hypothetical protein DFH07DRAFT_773787 [Mycena maculata]
MLLLDDGKGDGQVGGGSVEVQENGWMCTDGTKSLLNRPQAARTQEQILDGLTSSTSKLLHTHSVDAPTPQTSASGVGSGLWDVSMNEHFGIRSSLKDRTLQLSFGIGVSGPLYGVNSPAWPLEQGASAESGLQDVSANMCGWEGETAERKRERQCGSIDAEYRVHNGEEAAHERRVAGPMLELCGGGWRGRRAPMGMGWDWDTQTNRKDSQIAQTEVYATGVEHTFEPNVFRVSEGIRLVNVPPSPTRSVANGQGAQCPNEALRTSLSLAHAVLACTQRSINIQRPYADTAVCTHPARACTEISKPRFSAFCFPPTRTRHSRWTRRAQHLCAPDLLYNSTPQTHEWCVLGTSKPLHIGTKPAVFVVSPTPQGPLECEDNTGGGSSELGLEGGMRSPPHGTYEKIKWQSHAGNSFLRETAFWSKVKWVWANWRRGSATYKFQEPWLDGFVNPHRKHAVNARTDLQLNFDCTDPRRFKRLGSAAKTESIEQLAHANPC